ncbi:MAG: hypothetical protein ACI3ZP_01960 [Candidatus Cryptobacteroides sp.]
MTEELTYEPVGNNDFFSEVEGLLAEGKTVRIPAKGRSMEPFIREGRDEIVLRAGIEPKKGLIVLAKTAEGIVLHRIIGIDGDVVTLMGDGNLYKTETCGTGDILAGVSMIVKNGQNIDPGSLAARIKAGCWMMAKPVRRPLLKIWKLFLK